MTLFKKQQKGKKLIIFFSFLKKCRFFQ